jgi:hypothetical protein
MQVTSPLLRRRSGEGDHMLVLENIQMLEEYRGIPLALILKLVYTGDSNADQEATF